MNHQFNTSIAKKYDTNTAILLNHFIFWTQKNLANKKNIHDGLCWTYNTVEAFCKIFDYWTRHQIEHILKKLIENGLIVKGNYNESKYDRTCWYAITPKVYLLTPELCDENFIKLMHESLGENQPMDFGNFRNQFLINPKPIPDNKPDISDDYISPIIPLEISEQIVKKQKTLELTIKDMLESNPHNIDEELLNDWKVVRDKKKAPITKTAWNSINKELTKLYNIGISPLTCFEIMVSSGWQSIKEEWFTGKSKSKKQEIDHKDTSWYFDMQNDIF